MINAIIHYALHNRLLILLLVFGLAAGGYFAFKQLPVDAFPDATPTMVQVYTTSEGLSPVDVETLISYPIEISMYGLPHLEKVQSTSIFGLSRVDVYFEDGTDIYFARRLVMERLAEARRQIPPGLGEPQLGPITSGLGRILMYTLENVDGGQGNKHYSLMEKRTIQDWIVKPQLRTVQGVTGVLSIGGYEKQYQVDIDINALLARDLTVTDVREALAANNRNVGASFINRGGEEHIIRGYGWISPGDKGLRDIREIIVAEHNGKPVTIRDIAEVQYGAATRRGAQIANGQESAGGYVFKLIGANSRQVIQDVEARIASINKSLPDGLQIQPFYSQADLVNKAVSTVSNALLEGALLVLVFLYLFMGGLRSTLIVIFSLPLSVLFAFIAMHFAGLSANLMSLGGLAIAIGMMGDGTVVMVENIVRHMQQREQNEFEGEGLLAAAASEVSRPIVFAVGIIILVFLPLFTLQGVEGKLFKPMAYTITFALAGALLTALIVTPVLASLGLSRNMSSREPLLLRWSKALYRPVLNAVTRIPAVILAAAFILFAACLVLFPYLGTEFVPTLREGGFQIRSTLPPGASLESTIEYGKRIQGVLKTFPEVTGTYSRVGRAEVGGDPEPVNVVATVVTLKPLEQWQSGRSYEALQSAMADKVGEELPGLANNFSQPIQLRTDELLSGVQAQLVVSIFGEDLDKLADVGREIEVLAKEVPGATDVRMQQQGGKRQIVVKPHRDDLARYGISVDTVMDTLSIGVGGDRVGQVFDGVRRFDIFLRLQEDQRRQLSDIRQLPLQTPAGERIPLSRVADVEIYTGPKKISRSNASRRIYVQMNVRNRDMGSVVADLRSRIDDQVDMPPGYFIEFGGQFENQKRAMQRLYIVVPITLILIFVLLYSAFNSVRYATLIYLNIPFAISGGILALWLTGLYLSVPAAVGFIAVFGIAMQNGVVLVEYINQLRRQGVAITTAVRTGAEHRLRPVMMTALTTIGGLVPLYMASGIGAEVQRPLAAVVIGGLVTSTLLTLLVLPAAYHWFAENHEQQPAST